MTLPPLKTTFSPVMKSAAGETRKSTSWATSSGLAPRPRGTNFSPS